MAQLKDLIVNGPSRLIGDSYVSKLTISNSLIPESHNTQTLGSTEKGWKEVFVAVQDSGTGSGGVEFTNGTDLKGRVAGISAGVGLYAAGTIYLRPSLTDTTKGFVLNSSNQFYPSTDSSVTFGINTSHLQHGYFDDLYISTNTAYVATNSATAGTAITTGAINITGNPPKIELHRGNAAAITGTISSDSDYGIVLDSGTTVPTKANVLVKGDAPSTGVTYNNRTVQPHLYTNGRILSQQSETSGYFLNNVNAAGNGYYLRGNNADYGHLYITTMGTTSVQGDAVLSLGNGAAAGTNNNARGQLWLYGTGTTGTKIIPTSTQSSSYTMYLPNYAGNGYFTHTESASAVGSALQPVYVAANGRITAGNSFGNAKIFYGTCSTAAGTVAKVVTCTDFTAADLVTGAIVFVNFTNTNSGAVGSLTLNVNSTGAKNIKKVANGAIANLSAKGELQAGLTQMFTYNGTYWVLHGVDYNSDTNTLLRTYASATNINVPLLGQSSAASTTATWSTYADTYKAWYGVIPNNDALRTKINLSTGLITNPGGINTSKLLGTGTAVYGATLPSSGTTGQIFFQTTNDYYEIPAGGTTGQALVKNSATDRDVTWKTIHTIVNNTSVATSAWSQTNSYNDYPWRATVAISGLTSNYYAEVIFGLTDATSGIFAPIAETTSGGIYIYAKEQPGSAITIPTIIYYI